MKNRKILFGLLTALFIMMTGTLYWVFSGVEQIALFSSVTATQREAITAYLSEREIGYELIDDQIHVSNELAPKLRMELINAGIVQPERTGFEMFAESDYGQTEFSQRVNYQRALQAELERSIVSIAGIRKARVHLKLGGKKLLFSAPQPVTASVIVHMQDSHELAKDQVHAIQVLVAGSVENMSVAEVSVIDQRGKVLSSSSEHGVDSSELSSTMKHSAESLLSKLLPNDKFTVEVAIDYDQNKRKRRIESLANVSDKAVLKRIDHEPDMSKGKDGTTSRRSEVEYAYGRDVEEIEYVPGSINRVSVGVVINEPSLMQRAEEIERLLFAGLGLQKSRGDVIEILGHDYVQETMGPEKDTSTMARLQQREALEDENVKVVSDGADELADSSFPSVLGIGVLLVAGLLMLIWGVRKRSHEQNAAMVEELEKWLKAT